MIAAMPAISRTGAATSSSDRELTDRGLAAERRPAPSCPFRRANGDERSPQSAALKMIWQQHDGRFQRIDVAQDLVILQIDHCNGSIAHAFQIEKAILNEQVPLVGREHAMMGAGC